MCRRPLLRLGEPEHAFAENVALDLVAARGAAAGEPQLSPRADVLGLRLRVHDERNAAKLWGELLGGRCEQNPAGDIYRWADSALRIRVRVDRSDAEGPEAVEVAAVRAGALGAGGAEAMGSRFEPVAR